MKVFNLTYSTLNRTLFSNISFNTADQDIIKIIGSNGSGKSTLLKVILGITKKTSGVIEKNESIGYVPDSSEPYFIGMTPNILFSFLREQFSINPEIYEKTLQKNIELLKFPLKLMDDVIQNLSLGEKKKVMIIAALLINPTLYIMDEPFSGLDQQSLNQLISIIKNEVAKGKKFIIVTHDEFNIENCQIKTIRL